jgi:hypothetical protein
LNEREDVHFERLCRVSLILRPLVSVIGPAGDVLHLPFAIVGGIAEGTDVGGTIVAGVDFTAVYADEKILHDGRFVVSDPAGDVIVRYEGTSQAQEGAYDALLEGELPGPLPGRFSARAESTRPAWRRLNRVPLLGSGVFDATAATLTITLLLMPFA